MCGIFAWFVKMMHIAPHKHTHTMSNTIDPMKLHTVANEALTAAKDLNITHSVNTYNRTCTMRLQYDDMAGDIHDVHVHVTENMCSVIERIVVMDGPRSTEMKSHYHHTSFLDVVKGLNNEAKA